MYALWSSSELADQQCPVYVIGNKVDLLPRDNFGYLDRIKQSLLSLCMEHDITAQHVALVSAKTGYGIEKLISRLLRDWKLKGLFKSAKSFKKQATLRV